MMIDPTPKKVQVPAFENAFRKILRRGRYWISKDEVAALVALAGPVPLGEIIRGMGYSVAAQDDSGAIHVVTAPQSRPPGPSSSPSLKRGSTPTPKQAR